MSLTPCCLMNTSSIPVGATTLLIIWRFRLVARTHASHAWNTGSIPVGATRLGPYEVLIFFIIIRAGETCLLVNIGWVDLNIIEPV